jgi:eukaryotic-like serine/threonine-protein kinase
LFSLRIDTAESTALPLPDADLLSVSKVSELAILKADGVLARVPLGGGGARDVADNVIAADWAPDGTALALVRHDEGRQWLEYPIGTTIFRPAGDVNTLQSPRVSPDGELVAVLESGTFGSSGHVIIVDRSGAVRCRSQNASLLQGVAWTPDSREVWFNQSETGLDFAVHAVGLDGRERLVHRSMGTTMISDIATDGRALIVRQGIRAVMNGVGPGQPSERDLSWLDFSRPQDLSGDGRIVLFTESGAAAGPNPAAFVRPTDGSAAVQLATGVRSWALSPDGKWALATKADQTAGQPPLQMLLLPIGAGQVRVLEPSTLTSFTEGRWSPDGTRVIFNARDSGRPPRTYVQSVTSGAPTPITPEGVSSLGGVSPDSRFVLASGAGRPFWMYPVHGGSPFPAKGFVAGDIPLRWNDDGTAMWTLNQGSDVTRILRINVATGRREAWQEIRNADPAGLDPSSLRIVISADGTKYVFSYYRVLSDLYVAGGLR